MDSVEFDRPLCPITREERFERVPETRYFVSFGTKLHGNITATIAGTPSITIPLDARMKELAEYHGLTSLRPGDIESTASLQKLIDKVDIHAPEKKQRENYNTFVEFLKMNQLTPVTQEEDEKTYATALLQKITLYPPVSTSITTSDDERLQRMASLNIGNFKKETKLRNLIKHLEKTVTTDKQEISTLHADLATTISNNKRVIAERDKHINQLEGSLNRKSVRFSLAIANNLAALRKKLIKSK